MKDFLKKKWRDVAIVALAVSLIVSIGGPVIASMVPSWTLSGPNADVGEIKVEEGLPDYDTPFYYGWGYKEPAEVDLSWERGPEGFVSHAEGYSFYKDCWTREVRFPDIRTPLEDIIWNYLAETEACDVKHIIYGTDCAFFVEEVSMGYTKFGYRPAGGKYIILIWK